MFAKFSEKQTFLTLLMRVLIRRGGRGGGEGVKKCWFFGKFYERIK